MQQAVIITCSRSKKTEQLNKTLLRAHLLVQAPAPCEERYSNEPVRRERRAIYHINITSVRQSPDTITMLLRTTTSCLLVAVLLVTRTWQQSIPGELARGECLWLVDSCTVMLKLLCLFFFELNCLLVFKLLASLQLTIARFS